MIDLDAFTIIERGPITVTTSPWVYTFDMVHWAVKPDDASWDELPVPVCGSDCDCEREPE